MKIRDVTRCLEEFELLGRAYAKARGVLDKEGVPRFYIRLLADLEDYLNEVWGGMWGWRGGDVGWVWVDLEDCWNGVWGGMWGWGGAVWGRTGEMWGRGRGGGCGLTWRTFGCGAGDGGAVGQDVG